MIRAQRLKADVGFLSPSHSTPHMTLAITSRQEPTAKPVASQVQTSEVTPEVKTTVDPVFNQDFKFRVDDAPNSRLDVTLWDSDISTTGDEGFLGEVLLNIGKLMSYAGTAIQQTFTVRSMMGANGKTESCGQFVMILQYDHARKTSANVGAVGISIKMPMPWSEVKPDRPRYETAIRQMIIETLTSNGYTLDASRIETVGSERWKLKETGEEKGFMSHFNFHPDQVPHKPESACRCANRDALCFTSTCLHVTRSIISLDTYL